MAKPVIYTITVWSERDNTYSTEHPYWSGESEEQANLFFRALVEGALKNKWEAMQHFTYNETTDRQCVQLHRFKDERYDLVGMEAIIREGVSQPTATPTSKEG
jgi:hypothetical protein